MADIVEIVLVLLVVLVAGSVLARRVAVPEPLLFVGIGAALSLLPTLHAMSPPPDLILHVFLPLLVYASCGCRRAPRPCPRSGAARCASAHTRRIERSIPKQGLPAP